MTTITPSNPTIMPPGNPPSRGSGKAETPLARMHFDRETGTFGAP